MESEPEIPELVWSAKFSVAHSSRNAKLPGDKIFLPPSALEQLLAAAPIVTTDSNLSHITAFDPFNPYTFASERQARSQYQDRHQQLPHPLTFRLVNLSNGRVVYAGIREFSAEEGEIVLSSFLKEALGLEAKSTESSRKGSPDGDTDTADGVEQPEVNGTSLQITVHAKQLPKGAFVKLRPLEAGYDPEDWKSLLEEHLRSNFTTLTKGEVLVVYGGRASNGKREEFRFLVDGLKPEGDGICVVDTDLEVDIEALNEEQARETLKQIMAKRQKAPGTSQGSSAGGSVDLFKAEGGQALPGEYVDYELSSWDRTQSLEIGLSAFDEEDEIDLFVSPYSAQQRVRPREDEHVFAEISSKYPKRIRLQPTNVELENAEAIYISVRAFPSEEPSPTPKRFNLKVSVYDPNSTSTLDNANGTNATQHSPDEVECKNCHQWVPKSSLFLHENFCLRNNILCPQGCGQVFQRRSETSKTHWHCPHDTFTGNTALSHQKHDMLYHTAQTCPSCEMGFPSIPTLATHRVTECPGKLILCRFCHLQVPQEGDPTEPLNPELLLSGLTPHELTDGGRTTECHLCSKIVRFRDMDTHLKHHDLERLSRPAPRLCRNVNCGRTQDGVNKLGDTRAGTRKGQGPGNEIGLCSVCFGPLYVSLHDPEGKALRRRVERRYLSQLLTGCGKAWCKNEFCRTGRKNTTGVDKAIPTKDAIPLVKPFLEGMDGRGYQTPLHFCTDEAAQKRRVLAEMLSAEKGIEGKGGYGMVWCVAALEAEGGDLDKARGWLKGWAPQRSEEP